MAIQRNSVTSTTQQAKSTYENIPCSKLTPLFSTKALKTTSFNFEDYEVKNLNDDMKIVIKS